MKNESMVSNAPLEKDIQRNICEYLQIKKYFFWRSNNIPVFGKNNGGQHTFRALPKYTPRGLPDIQVIYKGKFVALEVKRPGPRMTISTDQVAFGNKCKENGGFYFIVTSQDDVVDAFLKVDGLIELEG